MLRLRLFFLFCMFYLPFSALSQSPEQAIRTIQDISIHSTAEEEQIMLLFEDSFTESLSPHFDSGLVRIALPGTSFEAKVERLHVNDRFIQTIRLYKESKNTIVEIQFADPEFQAVGRVSWLAEGNALTITIDKQSKPAEDQLDNRPIFSDSTDYSTAKPILFSDALQGSGGITVNIIKMLLAVAAVLLFFYGILWIYNKFFVTRFSFKQGDHVIKLVTSYHISPKQKIVVLNIDHATYACGVTPEHISLISEVTDQSFYTYLSRLKPDQEKGIDFTRLRSQYLERKIAKSNEDSVKPKIPFATELLNRVKKLKPID